MQNNPEFMKMLKDDIELCENQIKNGDGNPNSLLQSLIGKYSSIEGFPIVNNGFFLTDMLPIKVYRDLRTVHGFLIAYKNMADSKNENTPFKSNGSYSKVFIVHGRDNEAKLDAARFIEKLGFEAVILHEQVSGSKTIIEKIEEYSDVDFAVILYTPCDIGNEKNQEIMNPRARQNVIFEHGYFIGKLGRLNVCALVKGNVEIPNDISGVVYIDMDSSGAWMFSLAKEMKNVGYNIDMNKL